MAGLICTASAEDVALTSTYKTVMMLLAPTNQRLKLLGFGVYGDGTSASQDPIDVQVARFSTAGTASAATEVKCDDGAAETPQAVGTITFTAEPTVGDILAVLRVHPQSGHAEYIPFGQEYVVKGAGRIGLLARVPSGSVNVNVWMKWDE